MATTRKMRDPTGIWKPMIVLCMVSVDVDVDLVATGRSYRCTDLGGHDVSSLHLKSSINKWRSDIQGVESAATAKLRGKLDALDNKAEVGPLTPTDATARIDIVRELTSLERTKVMDLRQKAKNGLNILGSWITNPVLIKNHIYQFYESKFKETSNRRPSFTSNLFKHISVEDSNLLDCTITPQEIKDAIWDCGRDKAPEFDNTAYIPRGCNSSFITLIPKIDDPLTIGEFRPIRVSSGRQIIDGLLIVDEIISWAKKYKKRLMFLKVDFEKAFDSLNWSFLFSIMEQMGFSRKWRTWTSSCLKSAFASVLINGSPTKEFKVEKGLRQGDPLSLFLFIIAIKALNVALLNACNNNAFHGVKVGKDNIHVSHLQFADDALVMGEWSWLNAINLSRILTCFKQTRQNKYPNGTPHMKFPTPNKIINKLEGIRRIFFWGGTTDENKIAWIAWDKATSSISNGGLGIGTLKSINHAMLSKWWWRFHTENHAFWCKIIRSIHGVDGGLNDTSLIKSKSGPWYRIAKLKDDLSKIGIDLPSIFKKKIGDGCSNRFWLDTWLGGSPLKDTFPRLFRLDSNPACLVCNRCPTFHPLPHVSSAATSHSALTPTPPVGLIFNWAWSRPIRSNLELCELSELCSLVAHLHHCYGDSWTVPSSRWNILLPLKVNIFIWRTTNKRLPTIANLDYRGIDLDSVRCPMCDDAIETEDHIFVSCPIAKDTWKCIVDWWNIPNITIANLLEGLNLADTVPITDASISFFDVVVVENRLAHLGSFYR
ncbi:RNA-directed DNA polymerase, eukaryota [Tanacetum coccineum]